MYTCASVLSIKAVAIPNTAIIHIQNTAPGPPTPIANATPVIFPVPTREAALIVNAWNGETPESPSLFPLLNETFQEKSNLNKLCAKGKI